VQRFCPIQNKTFFLGHSNLFLLVWVEDALQYQIKAKSSNFAEILCYYKMLNPVKLLLFLLVHWLNAALMVRYYKQKQVLIESQSWLRSTRKHLKSLVNTAVQIFAFRWKHTADKTLTFAVCWWNKVYSWYIGHFTRNIIGKPAKIKPLMH